MTSGNKYIDETMPWVLAKDEAQKDRLETVLYNLIDSISKGAELLSSFMPETAEKILAQLNGGNVTDKPEILFQRLDLEEVIKKVEELHPPVEEEKEEEWFTQGPVEETEDQEEKEGEEPETEVEEETEEPQEETKEETAPEQDAEQGVWDVCAQKEDGDEE